MKLKAPLDLHPIHSPVFDTMFVCLIDFECLLGDTLQLTTVATYCFTPQPHCNLYATPLALRSLAI